MKQEMKTFEAIADQLDIKENLSLDDTMALIKITNYMMGLKQNPLRIVEIGSWKGWSTMILATTIKEKGGDVYAVDHWRGTEGTWNFDAAKKTDVFSVFRHNMNMLRLNDMVHVLMMKSEDAAKIFAPHSVDMVFIDASHYHAEVYNDITNWLPKIQPPGMMCGHDCEGYYTKFSKDKQRIIDENPKTDVIKGIGHPGVIKALYDVFEDKYRLMPGKNCRIWARQI